MTRAVGIVGLSGYEADAARVARALHYFETHDCAVRLLPRPEDSVGRFAASEAVRLAALTTLAADPAIDLVIGLRGGYGLTRLLPSMDFAGLAAAVARGQRWVGHSDFTALQLGLLAQTGATSFAGPLAGPDFGAESIDPFTEMQFWAMVEGKPFELAWPCSSAPCEVQGTLWGGNLAMLCSLVGTAYFPNVNGGILFLEDVNEQPFRIDRMLMQLELAGILGRQRALVLGDFGGMRNHEYDRGFNLAGVVDALRSRLPIPIVTDLPFGHGPTKATLPVGAMCVLNCDGRTAVLAARAA
jgi:muramoyltetrapeptide carboxypeptidase